MEEKEVSGIVTETVTNNVDRQYIDLVKDIMRNGKAKHSRTGIDTYSIFGRQLRFNMAEGFPLLTSKKMFTKGIVTELMWFLGKHMKNPDYFDLGATNIKYLVDNGCNIWVGDCYKKYVAWFEKQRPIKVKDEALTIPMSMDEFTDAIRHNFRFAKEHGNLGPVYGKQWRDWGNKNKVYQRMDKLCDHVDSIDEMWEAVLDDACEVPQQSADSVLEYGQDQIAQAINLLKTDPDSRRIIVNAWNVDEIDDMVLPPCHYAFQLYTEPINFDERFSLLPERVKEELSDTKYGLQTKVAVLKSFNVPERRLSLMWNQRSVDVPLGLPFNIASYGLLLHMFSDICNMVPHELIGNLGDTHIYENQLSGIVTQLKAEQHPLCKLKIKKEDATGPIIIADISDYELDSFIFEDYKSSPTIYFPLSN